MCTVYEQYGLYEQFVRAPKSARFSLFVSFYVLFKRTLLQNRGNLVYEWAGVILPGPPVPMLTHGRQVKVLCWKDCFWWSRNNLAGAVTAAGISCWFLARQGDTMLPCQKISKSFLMIYNLFIILSSLLSII